MLQKLCLNGFGPSKKYAINIVSKWSQPLRRGRPWQWYKQCLQMVFKWPPAIQTPFLYHGHGILFRKGCIFCWTARNHLNAICIAWFLDDPKPFKHNFLNIVNLLPAGGHGQHNPEMCLPGVQNLDKPHTSISHHMIASQCPYDAKFERC